MNILGYKALRRKTASLMNGWLMPRLGFKLVRSRPKTFSYEKLGAQGGKSILRVMGGASKKPATIALREGTSDWMTFDQIFLEEDYDLRPLSRYSEIEESYRRICAAGTPLILDLGANIGLSALYFSMVWPKATVVGLEPDPGNFALFQENVADWPNVRPVQAGASSRAMSLAIVDPAAGKNAFRTSAGQTEGNSIPGIGIAELLEKYRAEGCIPFAIKIDIEGAEAELFSANHEWVDEFPLLMIELHDWLFPGERTSQNFLSAVSRLDRDFVYLDENIFSIRNRRG